MDKFIVLAARRSGVTLLLDSLNSHPQIQCYKGVFTTTNRLKFFEFDNPDSRFYKFRSASPKRQGDYVFRRKRLISTFLTELYTSTAGVKAVGVRLSYIQAKKYPEVLEWALENDVGIIHLVRKNSLKAIVSHFSARKRGLHHSTLKAERVTIRLSPLRLKRRLTRLTRQIEKYNAMLADKRHIKVYYETFTANRDTEIRRILGFLEVDQSVPLTSDLIKLNPDSLENILENYEAITRAFKGTVFEKYLV
ncbi:MAG: sulfotransferase [Chloroflexota bacterium]|nr:sulfotransferase [Chloroflexota bacterium]